MCPVCTHSMGGCCMHCSLTFHMSPVYQGAQWPWHAGDSAVAWVWMSYVPWAFPSRKNTPQTAVVIALGERNKEKERSGGPDLRLIVNCIWVSMVYIHSVQSLKRNSTVMVAHDISYLKEAVSCGRQPWLKYQEVCMSYAWRRWCTLPYGIFQTSLREQEVVGCPLSPVWGWKKEHGLLQQLEKEVYSRSLQGKRAVRRPVSSRWNSGQAPSE